MIFFFQNTKEEKEIFETLRILLTFISQRIYIHGKKYVLMAYREA